MEGSYRVTIDCGLCTAKVVVEHEDSDAADPLVEQQALAAGFVPLVAVKTAERRRSPTWVCKACSGDVSGAYLEAGRRVQRPDPLPTLDSPAPPDGIAAVGLFAGLTQEEIAERGVYVTTTCPPLSKAGEADLALFADLTGYTASIPRR